MVMYRVCIACSTCQHMRGTDNAASEKPELAAPARL
jgi:hypothetical protein